MAAFSTVDVNECDYYHPCNENSLCQNTLGSYVCQCMSGFEQASATSKECVGNRLSGNVLWLSSLSSQLIALSALIDVDECGDESKLHTCHIYARCINTYGSYNCSCLEGYEGDGRECRDRDECATVEDADNALCNSTGTCVNTVGYYYCDCLSGFQRLNETVTCVGMLATE